MERFPAAVIGAGQAGLAVSRELGAAGVGHVVLEQGRVGEAWHSRRWDSFTLVTPNWTLRLPGYPYRGADPDGFLPRAGVVDYLSGYAADAPVREQAGVDRLGRDAGEFVLSTGDRDLRARQVVVATGAFQRPYRPAIGAQLDAVAGLVQLHTADYRAPDQLPSGGVLVVGSGQSGCQIAEELQLAGHRTYLSCGSCGWAHRRYDGHDFAWWMLNSGVWDDPADSLPDPAAKFACNPQVTGRDGGHDLNLRTLLAAGVSLVGRLAAVDGDRVRCAPGLDEALAGSDAFEARLRARFAAHAERAGLAPPDGPVPSPLHLEEVPELDLAALGIRSVLWATGYRPAYDWIDLPAGYFTPDGYPVQRQGSSPLPGLYFVGLNWLTTRKSGLLAGVGEDAARVARSVTACV